MTPRRRNFPPPPLRESGNPLHEPPRIISALALAVILVLCVLGAL